MIALALALFQRIKPTFMSFMAVGPHVSPLLLERLGLADLVRVVGMSLPMSGSPALATVDAQLAIL